MTHDTSERKLTYLPQTTLSARPVCEQAVWMHDKLKSANVEVKLLTLQGAGHGFRDEHAKRAEAELFEFFARHLKP